MFLTILSIISLLIIVLSLINLKWGCGLFLLCSLLMPDFFISLGGAQIGRNIISVIIFLIFLIKYKLRYRTILTSPLYFAVIFFLFFLLLIPFQAGTPFDVQIRYYTTDLCSTLLLPIMMYNIMKKDSGAFSLYRNILICSIIIATIYGVFLIFLDGVNPYVFLFALSSGDKDFILQMTKYYSAEGEGRMFGRISSVFYHPMRYACFLGFSLIFVYYIRQSIKKTLMVLLCCLLIVNIIICGVRSVIAATLVSAICYVLLLRKLRILIISLFFLVVGYSIVSSIPDLSSYLSSIIPSEETESQVSGSSLEMRIEQLEGSVDEVASSMLTGNGYGWNKYYISKYGDHPVILSFESLLFVVICNGGLIGCLIWFYFIFLFIKYCHKQIKGYDVDIFVSLLVFYLSFSVITGEYGYMGIFILFFILMFFYYQLDYRVKIKSLYYEKS